MKIRLLKRTDTTKTKADKTKVVETEKYDAVRLGSNLAAGNLTLVELDDHTVDSVGSPIHAKYHSVLAMEAARKMRRTRQKLKTGQQVCHHLKMMLAIEPFPQSSLSCGQAGAAASQFRLGF